MCGGPGVGAPPAPAPRSRHPSPQGWAKLNYLLGVGDLSSEIGAALGIKEQPRLPLATITVAGARVALAEHDAVADMAEMTKLVQTLDRW